MDSEKILRTALRIVGTGSMLAVGAVVMPGSWMAALHQKLGLGLFPDSASVDYLARQLSAFYVVFGGLFVMLAYDVRGYARLISYVGWATMGLGVVFTVVDILDGLPLWWIVAEGPGAVGFGVMVLALQRKISRDSSSFAT